MNKYIDAEKLKAEIERRIDLICTTEGFVQRDKLQEYEALRDIDDFINSLQQEQSPMGYDEAYLNECIAKASKTWKGVDVDKFIDEVRGRETVDLEEEVKKYFQGLWPGTETSEQCNTDMHFTPLAILRMVEYFYELGLKAKEESK